MLVKGKSVMDQGDEMQWSLLIIYLAKALQNLLGSHRVSDPQEEGETFRKYKVQVPLSYLNKTEGHLN